MNILNHYFSLLKALKNAGGLLLVLNLLQPTWTVAQTPPVNPLTQVFDDAKQYGKSTTTGTKAGINTPQGTTIVPYYGGAVPQSQLFGNGQGITSGPGTQRMAACTTNPNTGSAFNQQECEAVNFIAQSPTTRPQFTVTRNDPVLTAGATAISNAPATVGNGTVGGTYSACTTTNQTTAAEYRTEVCHNFATAEDNTCPITRDIVVDAKYNYHCDKSQNQLTNQTCNRTLTLACAASTAPGCTNGGLVNGGIQQGGYTSTSWLGTSSYLPVAGGAYELNLNTHLYNGYGLPQYMDVLLNFTVTNLADLSYLKLYKTTFKRQMSVWISNSTFWSGVQIYDSPNTFGFGPFPTQATTPVQTAYPDVDLKPYVVQGVNTIRVRTWTNSGTNGYSNVWLRSFMQCQPSCTETWNNGCTALETRQ